MARVQRQGNQLVNFKVDSDLDPENLNKLYHKFFPVGIYHGNELSKVDNSTIEVAPGSLVIEDSSAEQTVKVTTRQAIQLSPTPTSSTIVARWQFEDVTNNSANTSGNFCQFLAVDSTNSDDVILGEVIFDGNDNVDSFDLSNREEEKPFSDVDRSRLTLLQPEPTDADELKINVIGDKYTNSGNTETFNISTQEVGPFSSPSSNPRIDLVSINDQGNLNITQGTEGAGTPDYPSGVMVIAEVKISPGTTNISQVVDDLSTVNEGIRDVRPFATLGGGGGAGGSGVSNEYEGTLADGEDTINLPSEFSIDRKENVILSVEGTFQFPSNWTLVDSTTIQLDEPVNDSNGAEFYVRHNVTGSTTGGLQSRYINDSISDGDREMNHAFSVQDDASDISVSLNGILRTPKTSSDSSGYFVNSNNKVEFNYDLSSGDEVIIQKWSGGTFSTHSAKHESGGDDVIDAGQLGGSSGTNGQVLKTDGSVAFWDGLTGTSSGEVNVEEHTINVSASSTDTLSFDNEYSHVIASAPATDDHDDGGLAGIVSYNKSGGNYVGVDVKNGSNSNAFNFRVQVFGVIA